MGEPGGRVGGKKENWGGTGAGSPLPGTRHIGSPDTALRAQANPAAKRNKTHQSKACRCCERIHDLYAILLDFFEIYRLWMDYHGKENGIGVQVGG
jgi:hypothetical protein